MEQHFKDEIARILQSCKGRWNGDGFEMSIEEMTALRELIGIDSDVMDEVDLDDMNEDMDGDHASALASAGFGTDEDYGGYDGYEDAYADSGE